MQKIYLNICKRYLYLVRNTIAPYRRVLSSLATVKLQSVTKRTTSLKRERGE